MLFKLGRPKIGTHGRIWSNVALKKFKMTDFAIVMTFVDQKCHFFHIQMSIFKQKEGL